jgi:prevent-host-death family protein
VVTVVLHREKEMASLALTGFLGLYGDQVYSSTDLNRRSGEILNHARKGPVTISRNGEQFALLKREQAAGLVKAVSQFGPILELIDGILSVVEGADPSSSLLWLKAYGIDDLRKMLREVLPASAEALRETGDWDAVNAIIHEWHESAIVAMSGVFEDAMATGAEEAALPDPRSFVNAEEGLVVPGK